MALLKPGEPVLYTTRFPLMGGRAEVKFVDRGGRDRAERLARSVEAEAARIEAKFSRFRPDSVLARITAGAGGDWVPIDGETAALVQAALDLADLTGGRFDPTIGVLARAWDFRKGRVPSEAELEALLPLVDAGSVLLRPGGILLRHPGMELDLGGVGKEYAVDAVSMLLEEAGVASSIVNFAGDVRTQGRRSDGRPWSIGVQDPRERLRCRFAIRARARAGIATSGDYERYFEQDGVRYHHLLDATTGHPARGLASATVIAATASAAGRLATAAFLLGPERGLQLLEDLPGVEGALITEGDALLCTTGMHRISTLQEPSTALRS
jgi:thiamine biosynthesis lipoprotein